MRSARSSSSVERPQTSKWVGGLGEFYLRCDERVVEFACSKLGFSDAQRQFGRIFGALNFFFQLVWIGFSATEARRGEELGAWDCWSRRSGGEAEVQEKSRSQFWGHVLH